MTTPTVTELVHNGNRVGQRVELARYTIPAGQRVLYGQRVNGVVRFLPESSVAVGRLCGDSEDGMWRCRGLIAGEVRANAVRPKRRNDDRVREAATGADGEMRS